MVSALPTKRKKQAKLAQNAKLQAQNYSSKPVNLYKYKIRLYITVIDCDRKSAVTYWQTCELANGQIVARLGRVFLPFEL